MHGWYSCRVLSPVFTSACASSHAIIALDGRRGAICEPAAAALAVTLDVLRSLCITLTFRLAGTHERAYHRLMSFSPALTLAGRVAVPESLSRGRLIDLYCAGRQRRPPRLVWDGINV